MKPGPALSIDRVWAGGSASRASTSEVARALGLVPARLALTMAMLVDQSPISRRGGRSGCTEAGATSRARPSRRATVVVARLTASASWSRVDMLVRGYVVGGRLTRGPGVGRPAVALQLGARWRKCRV